jgi:hypothetical protein
MQSADKVLRFAGDVSIEKCDIFTSGGIKQDIAAQVIAITVYEDIFSPFISGSLTVRESFDLVNLFPFVGEEMVEIEIVTPTLPDKQNITGTFYIYKMTDRVLLGDKQVAYVLHFISPEAVIDLNKKISKVYSGKPEDIIKSLISDNLNGLQSKKEVFVEPTNKDIKFISNFWSPAKCINYVTSLAVNRNDAANYVFFENRYGFYFISLDSLYTNGLYQSFTKDGYTRDSVPGGGDAKNITEDFRRIDEVSIPIGFDYMDRVRSGMYSSKMISYDLNRKIYNAKNYNIREKYDKMKHLNPNKMIGDNAIFRANSLLLNYPRDNANFSGYGDATNYRHIQERISLMKLAEAGKLEITVPGRSDYTVGQKVAITLNKIQPVSQDDNDEDLVDQMFSGYYIISAINHYVTRERHECHMELIKDSLQLKIDRKNK